jgi:hypothetical protein
MKERYVGLTRVCVTNKYKMVELMQVMACELESRGVDLF